MCIRDRYYTAKEVSKWMFEIWCDPEQVTGIGKIPYKKLYKHTWQIIKRYIPEAKIGGSGLNATMPGNVLREQLCWWKDRYDRPDFLTFMSYPYQVERQEEQVTGKQYSFCLLYTSQQLKAWISKLLIVIIIR